MLEHASLRHSTGTQSRLQGSSADAAAGALGDWTLEGAPDLIQAVNVGQLTDFWESQTMTWIWIILFQNLHQGSSRM